MKSLLLIVLATISIEANAQSTVRWDGQSEIAPSSFGNLHPRVTLDRSGKPMVIWGRATGESVFFSKWDGTKFTTPLKLNGSLTIATASWMGPDIASHGDTVYVVMKQTPENSANSHIYIVRSEDGGATFTSPTRVDFIADSISRFPTVTCDDFGNPIVAYMKFAPGFENSRWVVVRSTDYGRTFSADTKASGWSGGKGICDCCPGAVLSSGDACAVLYRDNNNDIRDIWMGVSTNGGATFTNGCNVDNNNWDVPNCPATGPDGVVIGDSLYSVFCSGADGVYRTFLSRSSLNSVTSISTQRLTPNGVAISQQNYPRISSYGNAVGVVWKQTVLGTSQLPVQFTPDISKGFPARYDTVDLNDVTNGDIAIGNGTISVCWEDDNSGTVKFRSGTYKPSISSIDLQTLDSPFSITPLPANDVIHIRTALDDEYSATILKSTGEFVARFEQLHSTTTINVRGFASGMYILRIVSRDSAAATSFLIQR